MSIFDIPKLDAFAQTWRAAYIQRLDALERPILEVEDAPAARAYLRIRQAYMFGSVFNPGDTAVLDAFAVRHGF